MKLFIDNIIINSTCTCRANVYNVNTVIQFNNNFWCFFAYLRSHFSCSLRLNIPQNVFNPCKMEQMDVHGCACAQDIHKQSILCSAGRGGLPNWPRDLGSSLRTYWYKWHKPCRGVVTDSTVCSEPNVSRARSKRLDTFLSFWCLCLKNKIIIIHKNKNCVLINIELNPSHELGAYFLWLTAERKTALLAFCNHKISCYQYFTRIETICICV